MSVTHEDWQEVKERRETFAIRAARSLMDGNLHRAKAYAEEFDAADTELHRIGQETGTAGMGDGGADE